MGVNLWGESPLYENQGYPLIFRMLTKVRAEGKGDSVRSGLEEAGWRKCEPTDRNRIDRLTVPEAQSPGELARHNEAHRFEETG